MRLWLAVLSPHGVAVLVILTAGLFIAASATPVVAAGVPRRPMLGVNADLEALSEDHRDAVLSDLARFGVTRIRQPVRWSEVEPLPGQLQWSKVDAIADALIGHGLTWHVVLETSPAWSRRDPDPPAHLWMCEGILPRSDANADRAPPTDAVDLARFAARLMRRHGRVIGSLEVWREPNLLPSWRDTGPDPEDYAALLAVVAGELQRSAPQVAIVSAGLAPTEARGPCAMSDTLFLERVARAGGLDDVDAVGIQPFGLREPLTASPAEARQPLGFHRARELERSLRRHGVGKPLWAVAYGWRASGPGDSKQSQWGGFEPAVAARYDADAFALASAAWPWLEAMYLWHLGPPAAPNALGSTYGSTDWPDAGYTMLDGQLERTSKWGALERIASDEATAPEHVRSDPRRGFAAILARMSRAGDSDGLGIDGIDAARVQSRPWTATTKLAAALVFLAVAVAAAVIATAHVVRLIAGPSSRMDKVRASPLLDAPRRALQALALRPAPVAYALAVVGVAASMLSRDLAAAAVAPSWLGHGVGMVGVGLAVIAFAAHPSAGAFAVAASAPFAHAVPINLLGRPVAPIGPLIAAALTGGAVRWVLSIDARAESLASAGQAVPSPARSDRVQGPSRAWHWLRNRPFADQAAIGLLLWACASLLWSRYPGPAMREWRTVVLEPLVFYALLRARGSSGTRGALDGFVFGCSIAAGWAVAEVAGLLGSGGVAAEGVLRANGPYASPNNLALTLGRGIGLCVGWTAAHFASRSKPDRRTLAYAVAGVAMLPVYVLTFSRGGLLLGLPAVVLCGLALSGRGRLRKKPLAIAAAGALMVAVLLAPVAGTQRLSGMLDLSPGSTGYIRLRLWESATEMVLDRPVFGFGLDNFLPAYRDFYVKREVLQEMSLSHPHNAILDFWTRLGLPGVVLFGALIAANSRLAIKVLREGRHAGMRDAGAALTMQIYALAHGLVDNVYFLPDLALAWWIAQATLMSADAGDNTGRGVRSR